MTTEESNEPDGAPKQQKAKKKARPTGNAKPTDKDFKQAAIDLRALARQLEGWTKVSPPDLAIFERLIRVQTDVAKRIAEEPTVVLRWDGDRLVARIRVGAVSAALSHESISLGVRFDMDQFPRCVWLASQGLSRATFSREVPQIGEDAPEDPEEALERRKQFVELQDQIALKLIRTSLASWKDGEPAGDVMKEIRKAIEERQRPPAERHPEFRGFLWDQFEFVEPFALIRGALETFADFAEYLVDYRPPELTAEELATLELLWKRSGCDHFVSLKYEAEESAVKKPKVPIAAALGDGPTTRAQKAANAAPRLGELGYVEAIQGKGTRLTPLGRTIAAQRFGASPHK
jgi:hypothetical protein